MSRSWQSSLLAGVSIAERHRKASGFDAVLQERHAAGEHGRAGQQRGAGQPLPAGDVAQPNGADRSGPASAGLIWRADRGVMAPQPRSAKNSRRSPATRSGSVV